MNAYLAFCKKEFMESLRTYKLVIMLAAFVMLVGIMSPLIAKMLPELLSWADTGGIDLPPMPEPTAMDSWMQFFNNISQMGVIVLVIVFSGITANEFSRNTLVNMLTKGMKRYIVILAKFTVAAFIWTLGYLLALGVAFAYTAYYWEIEQMPHAFLAFASPWIYGLFLISLMALGGILFKSFVGTLLLTGGAIVAMSLLNLIPNLEKFNPISLGGGTLALLTKQKVPEEFLPALVVCLLLTVAALIGTVILFDHKQV